MLKLQTVKNQYIINKLTKRCFSASCPVPLRSPSGPAPVPLRYPSYRLRSGCEEGAEGVPGGRAGEGEFFSAGTYEKGVARVNSPVLNYKKTPRIVLAVTNDVATDQRVARHAAALQEVGFEVTVVGRRLPDSLPAEFPWRVERMTLRHRRGWRFYAEYNRRLRQWLLKERPDVVWANDADTLPGCYAAARRLGGKLVFDAHELFSEVPEIQHKPVVKWVWRTVERQLMPKCDARLTVCQSIADHYKKTLGVEMTVVRNLSRDVTRHVSTDAASFETCHVTSLLYGGCVNVGRGVDWAIDALEWLPQCRLVVAGDGDLLEQMKAYAARKPWADRITFTGRVTPEALAALTAKADVGLVMLEDMGLSYRYALPNRVGSFVQAGVPIVVSDLPEMAAVVRRFGVGEVIEELGVKSYELRVKALAEAVKKVLARQWTEADFAAAREDMDWNKEKKKLLDICYTKFC